MGGSSWFYECAYDGDLQAALDELRRRTFEAGDYEKAWDFARDLLAADLEEMSEMMGEPVAADSLERLRTGAPPASIDEARTWAMESGTHSILDVDRVVDAFGPDRFGVVAPLPADRYDARFGTPTPTVEQVRAAGHDLSDEAPQRWTGVAVTGYLDGAPAALFFAGASGD